MNAHHPAPVVFNTRRSPFALKSMLLAASSAAFALAALPADAAFTDNTYPALQCVYHSGGVPTPTFGMLENRTTQTAVVECPIPLIDGQDINRVKVAVWNGNSSATVTCTKRKVELSATFAGGYRWFEDTQSSVLVNDWQNLEFKGINVDPSYETHAFVRCEIPPADGTSYSRIGQYKTDN